MGEVFKLNHCYNMDCLPAMELFPDNYFDLAVVDPPYFSGPERRGFYTLRRFLSASWEMLTLKRSNRSSWSDLTSNEL